MQAGVLIVLLLWTILVSGCANASGRSRIEAVVTPTIAFRPTETTIHEGPGAIAGVVLDDEFRPLNNSLIEIFRRKADIVFQITLRTDENGMFSAKGLAGGEYVVYASRKGYEPHAPLVVLVEDGKTTEARWILQPAPLPGPFHETRSFRQQLLLYVCPTIGGNNLTNAGDARLEASSAQAFMVDEVNKTTLERIVVEARWLPAASACVAGVETNVFSPDAGVDVSKQTRGPSNPYWWDNVPSVHSPTRLTILRTGENGSAIQSAPRIQANAGTNLTTQGIWRFQVEPYAAGILGSGAADLSCMADQSVETFVTFFYGKPVPRWNWSIFDPLRDR